MDYYQILGVSSKASPEELRKSYISLSLKHHPDRSTDPTSTVKFQEIANAYSVLCDPVKRKEYDQSLLMSDKDVDPFQLFTSVFDDLLIPEVPNPVYYYQLIGAIAGIILGFIILNIPGAIFGYYFGSKMGKVRDMKGVCVYEAFTSLPIDRRMKILSDISLKILGSAFTIKNS
jgi:curved DNA-binding protein CbpA